MSETQKNIAAIVLSTFFMGAGLSGLIMYALFMMGYII